MKLRVVITMAFMAIHATAAMHTRELAAGMQYYEQAEFAKAAARFQVLCNVEGNAEACYWTGAAYERLADTRTPYGCRTAAKASPYFTKAMALAPDRPAYRDALFDYLVDHADCSRTALWEAAGILSMIPESDPAHALLRDRLIEAAQWNRSLESRLANVFLAVPRATYRISVLPAALVSRSASGKVPAVTPQASRQISPKPLLHPGEASPE
jgi:hypothetical protein